MGSTRTVPAGATRVSRLTDAFCWSAIIALLIVSTCHSWYGFDIWYHLALGREVVEQASPGASGTVLLHQSGYRNIYWAFQVLAWSAYCLGGMFAVTLLLTLLWLGTFVLWAKTANVSRYPPAGVPLLAVAIVSCQLRFEERPEVFSYLLLALHIWLIGQLAAGTLTRGKVIVWVSSQVAWTNVHGYFVLGPSVLALWIASASLTKYRSDRLATAWKMLGVVSLATTVSPFGLGAWWTVVEFARYFAAMKGAVIEFHAYPFSGYGWTTGFFWAWSCIVIVLALRDVLKRKSSYEPVLGMLGVVLGASSARNAPLAVVMSGPLFAHHVERISECLAVRGRHVVPGVTAVLALGYIGNVLATGSYAPLVVYEYSPGSKLATDDYPVEATQYLRRNGFSGSLFVHPSDGSYLEFALPSVRPYGDTRFIDSRATERYFRALRDPAAFSALNARWNFDAVLVNIREEQTHLVSLLEDRGTWTLIYADPYRCVLANNRVRTGSALVPGPIRFYAGQTFERPVNYNAAGSWLQGFAEAGRTDLFVTALRQLGAAPDFPPEFRTAARAYALKVGNAEIAEAALAPSRTSK